MVQCTALMYSNKCVAGKHYHNDLLGYIWVYTLVTVIMRTQIINPMFLLQTDGVVAPTLHTQRIPITVHD